MTLATPARAAKKTVAAKPPALGTLIDTMFDLREQKRALEAQIKKIEAEVSELDGQLMERMNEEGTDSARGKKATASITTGIVGDVTDWSVLEAFIKKTGNFQLFQRRLSDAAYRELLETKGKVPGVEPFTKKRLNLRVLSASS